MWRVFQVTHIHNTKMIPKATSRHLDYNPGDGNSLLVSAWKALISSKGRKKQHWWKCRLPLKKPPTTNATKCCPKMVRVGSSKPMRWTEGLQDQSWHRGRIALSENVTLSLTESELCAHVCCSCPYLTWPGLTYCLASLMVMWQLTVWAKRKHTLTKELRGRL